MALAYTNVTEKIAVNGEMPIMFGDSGLIQEIFEIVDSGGTSAGADTTTLTPRYIKDIRHIASTLPVTDTLNLANVNSTVDVKNKIATLTTEKYRLVLIGRR